MAKIWLNGASRSGKTSMLIAHARAWCQAHRGTGAIAPGVLFFVASREGRLAVRDALALVDQGQIRVTTLLGFIREEVDFYFPLIAESQGWQLRSPVYLRPETEQGLATELWRSLTAGQDLPPYPDGEYMLVRRGLDWLQLAGAAGLDWRGFPGRLAVVGGEPRELWPWMESFLDRWQGWCYTQGLLTYGLMYHAYAHYLLPHPTYQGQLKRRFGAILGDDLDDYPAIALDLFRLGLAWGWDSYFSFNLEGQGRLGLNGDPETMATLAGDCEVVHLTGRSGLGGLALSVDLAAPPAGVEKISHRLRAKLLQAVTDTLAQAIAAGQIAPQEIAIIAPGLDDLSRYLLLENLGRKNIPVIPLNEQRPLIASPLVRSVLTLFAFVYPGLGDRINREGVAEMLVLLCCDGEGPPGQLRPLIDPVRAGLLADACYQPHPQTPQLLPETDFARWDRLGARATQEYRRLRLWLGRMADREKEQGDPLGVLYQAIQDFYFDPLPLTYEQTQVLRTLMETAQHFWTVDHHLQQGDPRGAIRRFVILLQEETISAQARPAPPLGDGGPVPGITLANIYQYRRLRSHHRWHIWLDAGSPLWERGDVPELLGAAVFLRQRQGQPWTPAEEQQLRRDRLHRVLGDLLGRAEEKVILCHSDLDTQGREQFGPLLPWVEQAPMFAGQRE